MLVQSVDDHQRRHCGPNQSAADRTGLLAPIPGPSQQHHRTQQHGDPSQRRQQRKIRANPLPQSNVPDGTVKNAHVNKVDRQRLLRQQTRRSLRNAYPPAHVHQQRQRSTPAPRESKICSRLTFQKSTSRYRFAGKCDTRLPRKSSAPPPASGHKARALKSYRHCRTRYPSAAPKKMYPDHGSSGNNDPVRALK